MDADGANPTRLSPDGAYDASPTWAPDGSRIAFENRRDNSSEGHIWVMMADGTDRVQLTSNRQPNFSPAWSPDGRRITYVTYRDSGSGNSDIYLMNADGTNREPLTSDEELIRIPRSPLTAAASPSVAAVSSLPSTRMGRISRG
jgi:Tol biopolymer transport system component